MTSAVITIGTRGSPLAMTQARQIRQALLRAHGFDEDRVDVVAITTTGDRITDRPLSQVGGKGLFTREIERALLDGAIDVAVHSAKDMATQLPAGLQIACIPPRIDARDAFVCPTAGSLNTLAPGARVGTASLRRQALVRRLRPDVQVDILRGNVGTRLERIATGHFDATILAYAGLLRLGRAQAVTALLPLHLFVPAPGQGALALQIRAGDAPMKALVAPLHDAQAAAALDAERAFLAELDGSCRTPIAAHAYLQADRLALHGMLLSPNGDTMYEGRERGCADDAAQIGSALARTLKARAGDAFLQRLRGGV